MSYDITVITPTSDRPVGIELAERWMKRQTFRGRVQWIIADDGVEPCRPTMGQLHVHRERLRSDTGALSLGKNLLAALEHVDSGCVVIWEDDDLYKPGHLADLYARIAGGALAAGDDKQRYYNVQWRRWRQFNNKGASLCQTAFSADLVGEFRCVVNRCMSVNSYGFDRMFWSELMESGRPHGLFDGDAEGCDNVVGIKGLPGRPGNGIGHRPDTATWHEDRHGQKLREWCGDDWTTYEGFFKEAAA